ncbi:MAG TPA: winged helix DNA-binding domain-containing protein [Thermomicrobiales bacterium]|nr:winged helix DNA-binding domain-containing protein [Thermomicrobiales bacterium]
MTGTSAHEVALLRLVAQRIAGPRLEVPAEAVRWLAAAQGQDYPGGLTSIALRTATGTRTDVEASLNRGEIVRSWPMRGTLHLVAAEDLPWMLELTAPRMLKSAATRRAQLGLDASVLDRARQLAVDALRGGNHLTRSELLGLWSEASLNAVGPRGSHMLAYLAQTGVICFGPVRGNEQLIVLIEEWIPRPRHSDREQRLGEWMGRYFRSHGPATVRDAARWTGLTLGDVRAGLASARPGLSSIEVDDVEHFMAPETPALLEAHRDAARGVFLLPGFDELLLGYADRSATLPAAFADRVVPGGNGVFQPTVVDDGRVVATWRRVGRGAKQRIDATPFTVFRDEVSEALPGLFAVLP